MAAQSAGVPARIGFVFDLDGVIYHSGANGKALVPGTLAALSLLERHRVPYAFVSNGTGYSELEKATLIEGLLDAAIRVPREKVFLCATPMRDLAKEYAGRRVLIVGGDIVHGEPDTARRLATDLGFCNFVTMAEFAARRPHLMPIKKYETSPELMAGKSLEPIAACFVLHEPGDWHESLQLLTDIAACGGDVKQLEPDADLAGAAAAAAAQRLAEADADGAGDDDEPTFNIYLTNPDIVYPVRNAPPRYTLGSYGLCLGAMYQRLTTLRPGLCGPLTIHYCGKPFPMVFDAAQRYLEERTALVHENGSLDAVYMVGDNPPSDIQGANNKGAPWQSCLVRTGNFHGVDNDPTYPARHVFKDAHTVVTTMLARHGIVEGNVAAMASDDVAPEGDAP